MLITTVEHWAEDNTKRGSVMKQDWSILEWSFYLFQLSKHKASKAVVASRTWKRSGRKQVIRRRIDSLFSFIVTSLYVRLYVMWVRIAKIKKHRHVKRAWAILKALV